MDDPSSRSDLLRMGAVLGLLLLVGGIVLLVGGAGGDGDGPGAGPDGRATADGRIVELTEERIVLAADSGARLEYAIRPIDRRVLGLDHLRVHMAQGLPSRVISIEADGARYAVRVDDLPPP